MSSTSSVGASNSLHAQGTSRQVERLISRADANGDGQLSLSEFNAIGQNQPGRSADSSGSAASATGSTGTDRSALFSQIDTNGDGQLSSAELSSYQKQQVASANSALLNLQEAFGGGSQSGGVHGKHGHHRHQASVTDTASTDGTSDASQSTSTGDPSLDALFKTLDADGSGSISPNELSTYLTKAISSYSGASAGASATAG